MAYSGTQTFNLAIEEIIQEAFERCQLEVREGYDLKTAKRSLNLMLTEWANRGLNLWTIEYATQTLTAGTNYYSIDQKVVDIVDAVVTTTTGATSNLEGDSSTTDVSEFGEDHIVGYDPMLIDKIEIIKVEFIT